MYKLLFGVAIALSLNAAAQADAAEDRYNKTCAVCQQPGLLMHLKPELPPTGKHV